MRTGISPTLESAGLPAASALKQAKTDARKDNVFWREELDVEFEAALRALFNRRRPGSYGLMKVASGKTKTSDAPQRSKP